LWLSLRTWKDAGESLVRPVEVVEVLLLGDPHHPCGSKADRTPFRLFHGSAPPCVLTPPPCGRPQGEAPSVHNEDLLSGVADKPYLRDGSPLVHLGDLNQGLIKGEVVGTDFNPDSLRLLPLKKAAEYPALLSGP